MKSPQGRLDMDRGLDTVITGLTLTLELEKYSM